MTDPMAWGAETSWLMRIPMWNARVEFTTAAGAWKYAAWLDRHSVAWELYRRNEGTWDLIEVGEA